MREYLLHVFCRGYVNDSIDSLLGMLRHILLKLVVSDVGSAVLGHIISRRYTWPRLNFLLEKNQRPAIGYLPKAQFRNLTKQVSRGLLRPSLWWSSLTVDLRLPR